MLQLKIRNSLLLAALMLLLVSSQGYAKELSGKIRWSGQVDLKESIVVMPKSVLIVAPGTKIIAANAQVKLSIRGRLEAVGTAEQPIVFRGAQGWQGVEFMEAPKGSRFNHVHFESATAAISSFATDFTVENCTFRNSEFGVRLLRESGPVISHSTFENNQVGVANEMKSSAKIENNQFANHGRTAILASHNSVGAITGNRFTKNKHGITLLQRFKDRITGNLFTDNNVGIYCNQTQNTPLIEENEFTGNDYGVLNFSFAYPALRNNRFIGNKTAVHNDQYGSPLVENNLLRNNETALYNYRKSNPKVLLNSFEDNQLAMFCDFSSYPQVKNNNFLGNALAVKLGIYQSADWEKRSGSKAIMQKEASARKSQNPLLAQAPETFDDFVDVTGNWWGEDTARLAEAGNGNSALFYDRHDKPDVTYEDYGPGTYKLDWVRFSPWLDQPVAGTGPVQK